MPRDINIITTLVVYKYTQLFTISSSLLGMLERGSLFSLIIGTCKSENVPGLKHIKLDLLSLSLTKLSFAGIWDSLCTYY